MKRNFKNSFIFHHYFWNNFFSPTKASVVVFYSLPHFLLVSSPCGIHNISGPCSLNSVLKISVANVDSYPFNEELGKLYVKMQGHPTPFLKYTWFPFKKLRMTRKFLYWDCVCQRIYLQSGTVYIATYKINNRSVSVPEIL